MLKEPEMINYVARYRLNLGLLKKHPENRKMLEKKINEARDGIIKEALKMFPTIN